MRPHVVAIPMRTAFRGITVREALVWEGPEGWAEWSPFTEYPHPYAARWLACAHEAAEAGWPAPVRSSVPVNCTVPAVGPRDAHALVSASGCSTAKVKVAEPSQEMADDIARVEAVRDALGPGGRIRVDANGAWDVDTAERHLGALAVFDLEYAEQPVATLEEMARLRRRVDIPLAADESVRTADDPLRVAGLEAADIVVLKVQPLGGVHVALQVAEACGLPVVVSSALETSVGLAAGVALAAALPELPYACGLATGSLLTQDIVADPLVPIDGHLTVRRPVADPAALSRLAADEATTRQWLTRLAACEPLVDQVTGWAR